MSAIDPIIDTASAQSSIAASSHMPCPDPGLYIVATPIGNLRDITLRALDVLTHADIILAEDTRQTQKLLNAYNIRGTLTAYHDHNAAKRIPSVLKDLEAGKIIVQVSDAGTPLVSDPGFKLVRAAAEAGHKITPVPGASALLAALTSAALPTDRFMFAGFLPSKSSARVKSLETLKMVPGTLVFFESAGRLNDSLEDIRKVLGDRSAAIARELTKKYEETRRGKISVLLEGLAEDPPRGEIVVVIGPPEETDVWDEAEIDKALLANLEEMGVKRASAHIAEMSGWPKRDVYQRALSLS